MSAPYPGLHSGDEGYVAPAKYVSVMAQLEFQGLRYEARKTKTFYRQPEMRIYVEVEGRILSGEELPEGLRIFDREFGALIPWGTPIITWHRETSSPESHAVDYSKEVV